MLGVVALIPVAPGLPGRSFDKLFHLCEYLLLAWGLAKAAHASGFSRAQGIIVPLVLAAGYGALLEGAQFYLPYRQAEWWDGVANLLGAGLGTWWGLTSSVTQGGH